MSKRDTRSGHQVVLPMSIWFVLFCLLDYCCWSLHFKFAERFIYIAYSVILGPSRSSMVYVHMLYQSIVFFQPFPRPRCPRVYLIRMRLFICFVVFLATDNDVDEDAAVSRSFVFVRLGQKCFNCFASKSLSFNFSLLFRVWQASDLYICIYYANMWWGFCWWWHWWQS